MTTKEQRDEIRWLHDTKRKDEGVPYEYADEAFEFSKAAIHHIEKLEQALDELSLLFEKASKCDFCPLAGCGEGCRLRAKEFALSKAQEQMP